MQINEEVQHGTLCDESNDIIGIPAMGMVIYICYIFFINIYIAVTTRLCSVLLS